MLFMIAVTHKQKISEGGGTGPLGPPPKSAPAQALRAGSSNSVLDGSLDGDVSFTTFMNNVAMNITY